MSLLRCPPHRHMGPSAIPCPRGNKKVLALLHTTQSVPAPSRNPFTRVLGGFFLVFFPNVVVIPNVKVPNMFLLSNLQMFCVIFAASFSGLCLCPPAFLPWIIESWRCACSIPVSGPKWE